METEYPLKLTPEADGQWTVQAVDVPGAISHAGTSADAVAMGTDALIEMLDALMSDGDPIPAPSEANGRPVAALPLQVAAKILIYRAMQEAGVRKAELARRLGIDPPKITRLLDLRHGTAMDTIERALAALGHRSALRAVRLDGGLAAYDGVQDVFSGKIPGETADDAAA